MMKRFISLFLCVVVMCFSAVAVLGAEAEETIPIPERPEEFYIIDQPGVITERAYRNIIRKGDRLFAITGAQVVIVIVDENNKVELGLLAQQILERWEIGAYERDNGFVIAIDFNRGRASYAVGEGLSQLFTANEVVKLITNYELGDGYAAGNYVNVVNSLYNDVETAIYEYYEVNSGDWDGTTYLFQAGYEVEEEDNSLLTVCISAAGLVLFFLIVIISAICHNKRMSKIRGYEKEGGYSDEEDEPELTFEAENIGEVEDNSNEESEEVQEEEYCTDEGEYNTDEGEYCTDANETEPVINGGEGWEYN